MTLGEKRVLFTGLLGGLLAYAAEQGILVALDEVKRGKQQAEWNAAHGVGIVNTLHGLALAADLLLYRRAADGSLVYVSDGDAPEYARLGAWWKAAHELTCWGGDFGDPDHFSVTHNGVR